MAKRYYLVSEDWLLQFIKNNPLLAKPLQIIMRLFPLVEKEE